MSKVLVVLILGAVVPGCVTPEHWTADSHKEMMGMCRMMCGDKQVRSYDTWTAKCLCKKDQPLESED